MSQGEITNNYTGEKNYESSIVNSPLNNLLGQVHFSVFYTVHN